MKLVISLSALSLTLMACGTDDAADNPTPENEQEVVKKETVENKPDEEQELEEEKNWQEEKIRFVTKSIDELYNFDNESYDERNQKLLNNFTKERANELTNLETLDSAIDFESTGEIDNVYQDIAEENRFVVEAEMSFQVEDNEATIFRNLIILTIDEGTKEYRITEMETVPVQRPSMVP